MLDLVNIVLIRASACSPSEGIMLTFVGCGFSISGANSGWDRMFWWSEVFHLQLGMWMLNFMYSIFGTVHFLLVTEFRFLLSQQLYICTVKVLLRFFKSKEMLMFTSGNSINNWQNRKSTFLTRHCHKISRIEEVGLKNSNYTFKITIFVRMWNLGQFREKLIFCQ